MNCFQSIPAEYKIFVKISEVRNVKPEFLYSSNTHLKKQGSIFRSFQALPLLITGFLIILNYTRASSDTAKKWVGTWSTAPYSMAGNMPPSPGLANNSLRQVVRLSIGGDTLRIKFANTASTSPVSINSATIAVSTSGKDTIDVSTIKALSFNSKPNVTIGANTTITSDPLGFNLKPNMKLAITIYYGQTPSTMTGHVGSRTTSYLLSGDKNSEKTFGSSTKVAHWYSINTIEVLAPHSAAAVAVLGNSITDGYGLTPDLQNRWTDIFSEALLNNPATEQVAVLNLGIGATNVVSGANSGISRYKRDILEQNGLRWFIIFYGVNDINGGASANTIINAYKQMVADAHDGDIFVYGATLTPFNGHSYYTPAHEAVRKEVNSWIRTTKEFDGFIDFDKIVRDQNDTSRFKQELKNDWLHPNTEGYKVMGQSVDLSLFVPDMPRVEKNANNAGSADVKFYAHRCNGMTKISFELPYEDFVSLKVYSMQGREITGLDQRKLPSGRHELEFISKNMANGIYLYSLNTSKGSFSRPVVY